MIWLLRIFIDSRTTDRDRLRQILRAGAVWLRGIAACALVHSARTTDRDPLRQILRAGPVWLRGIAACALVSSMLTPITAATVSGKIALRDSREAAVAKRKDYSGVI